MSGWTRAGAGAGLVGAVLYVVSAFVAGSPPKPDDSTATIVAHLQDKRDALLIGSVLALVGLALFLWFLGYLRSLLAEAEASIGEPGAPLATITLTSFVVLFAVISGGGAALNVVVWRGAGSFDPTLVRLAFDAQTLSLYAITATVALLSVLAPTVVIARTGVLPRWLVILGAAEIAVNVVELAGFFSRSGWNTGGFVAGLGPLVWVVWVAAVSICMMRRKPEVALSP